MYSHPDEIRKHCEKLITIVDNADLNHLNHCSFAGLSSALVSVQSMFDQINAFTEGMHSLQNLVKWHVEEGHCVAAAIKSQTRAVCLTDAHTCDSLQTVYGQVAGKKHHRGCLPVDQSGLGHGVELSGHHLRTFPSVGIRLTPELLGQDIDWLATQFAKFDASVFMDRALAWKSVSETLESLSRDLYRVAVDIESEGSRDAYTQAAGQGMHRWIRSLDELGEQAGVIGRHIDSYSKSYEYAYTQINGIANEADRRRRTATPEHPYRADQAAKYREEVDRVLEERYNPSLIHADAHAIEMPIPLRALHADDTVHIPKPRTVFNGDGAGVGGAATGYTSSLFQNHPQQSTPHPRHVTSPTNRVGDVPTPHSDPHPNPGQGSGHNPHPGDQPGHPGHPGHPGDHPGGYPVPPVGSHPQITQPHPGSAPGPHPGASAMPKNSPIPPARTGSAASPIAAQGPAAVSGDGVPYYPGHWSRNNENTSRDANNSSGRSDGRSLGGTALIGAGVGAGVGAGINRGTGSGSGSGFAGTSTGFSTSTGTPVKGSTPKTTITPNTPAGASNTGAGRPGMGGMPGAPGMGAQSQQTGKSQKRRHRRSAANTERILPQPGNLLRGPIRHPDDPLYGTGR